jgi:hypothetical protein
LLTPNRFEVLSTEDIDEELGAESTDEAQVRAGVARCKPTNRSQMRRVARPHQESYFLAGKVAGKTTRFLLDTGCTTNLLSKSTYDNYQKRLKEIWSLLTEYKEWWLMEAPFASLEP